MRIRCQIRELYAGEPVAGAPRFEVEWSENMGVTTKHPCLDKLDVDATVATLQTNAILAQLAALRKVPS